MLLVHIEVAPRSGSNILDLGKGPVLEDEPAYLIIGTVGSQCLQPTG